MSYVLFHVRSQLSLALFISIPLYGQIVLNEVMFDPAGSDQTDEFIEIVNVDSLFSIDLTGWRIGDEGGDEELIDAGMGMILAPGHYAVIFDQDYFPEKSAYQSIIPVNALILAIDRSTFGSRGLSNSRVETIRLMNGEGLLMIEYMYTIGNRPGRSDEKIDLFGGNDSSNWDDSCCIHGTPGLPNSVSQPLTESVQVEIHPNPFSPDDDGFEDTTEIHYGFPSREVNLHLCIYDIKGRLRCRLVGGESVRRAPP